MKNLVKLLLFSLISPFLIAQTPCENGMAGEYPCNGYDLQSFISLEEMDGVKLMNRTDTKFTFSISVLPEIFQNLSQFYDVLEIYNKRIHEYKSLYFDTKKRKFYYDHHNQRVNRFKVRFREYVDSGLTFLEVKRKNNKGKTIKKRLKVKDIVTSIKSEQQEYINKIIGQKLDVFPRQFSSSIFSLQ
jgi:hypothetical protein